MKSFLTLLLTVLFITTFSACDGNKNPTGPGDITPNNGTMTATVDGNSWSAVQIAAVNSNGVVAISGSNTALLAVGFGFVGQSPGTYPIGSGSSANGNVIGNQSSTWSANSFQGSGTINVATLTATAASGTFSFTAPLSVGSGTPATRVVTNGTFNITF